MLTDQKNNTMASEKHLFVALILSTLFIATSNAQSAASTSFSRNPVNNDGTALFNCQVYNLGSYTVSIERTIFSRTEQLSSGSNILPSVDDNFFLSTFNENDGSKIYSLTIRGVYHRFDAGTYTCKIMSGSSVITQSSTDLNINYTPESPDPRCSVVGSSSDDLTRTSGSEVRLACHSEIGYPPVDISWSYEGCNSGRALPQPTLSDSGAYYSELRVTLTGEDNGGMFICTISRPDGSFSRSCSKGPFLVTGGTTCGMPPPMPPQVTPAPQPPPPQPTQPVSNPSTITASFQSSSVDEGMTAILICQVYNLGSNFVSIERTISSTTESLALGTTVLPNFGNRMSLSVQNNNDGSQTYTMTISQLNRELDTGTYTCSVQTPQRQVLATQSVVLQINVIAVAPTPANPYITASFQTNPVDKDSNAVLICQVHNLGSNFVSIERAISSTTESVALGSTVLQNFANRISLSVRNNNDGSQTYMLIISQANRQMDAGTYTCSVQTSQRQVLATQSAVLQINVVAVAPTPANNPYITASFQTNPVNENRNAILICQVYNLGSNFISIERIVSSTIESLTLATTVLPNVADNIYVSVLSNNDGSQTYTLTIREVTREKDAGTYTCRAVTSQRQVLAMQSAVLQINAIAVVPTPATDPYVTTSFETNPVNEGSSVNLICQVYNLGSNFVSIDRTISSTTQSLTLGTQVQSGFTNDLLLSVRNNNDGSQIYTLTIIDANPQQDAGVYTCKVENFQRQLLAMNVAVLQINMLAMTPTPSSGSSDPYITASFQTNPVDEGNTAVLTCQIYNLGLNEFVSIERTISGKTESISAAAQVFPAFASRVILTPRDSSGGSKTYTVTISQLSRLDAGTYTCKVETFQRQVRATRSAFLQINTINGPVVPSAPSVPNGGGSNGPRVTASFQVNPIDEDGTALLICRAYNLGSHFVSIERTFFSRTEQLSVATQILQSVDDNVYLSVQDNNDGSKSYSMTIRRAHHQFDAGTYTCKVESPQRNVVSQNSAVLNINYDPQSADPRCAIVGSSPNLNRPSGTEVRLGCHSELGYPPVDISWTYRGCNKNRNVPKPTVTNSGAYYSELRVTLSEEDNGGIFTCTISRPDGSFSESCSRGPFVIPGGRTCNIKGSDGERKGKNSSNVVASNAFVHIFSLILSLFVTYLFWK